MDKHYTPLNIARSIVAGLKIREPRSIADFAVGDASLITAMRERWPRAQAYGTDIDSDAIERVSARLPDFQSDLCDFLSPAARARSPLLSTLGEAIDLVFINPPFSCRGSSKMQAEIGGETLGCSAAMAFVAATLPYVASRGAIVAILPSSCLTSEKDALARRALNRLYDLQLLGEGEINLFTNCSVHTVFVMLKRRPQMRKLRVVQSNASQDLRWIVVRGALPAATPSGDTGAPAFVHSTELVDGHVTLTRGGIAGQRTVTGPAILIPRVGRPTSSKICWLEDCTEVVLSDCVIAVQAPHRSDLESLRDWLVSNWSKLEAQYVGSCARYITVLRLRELLAKAALPAAVPLHTAVEPGKTAFLNRNRIPQSKPQRSIS